MNRLIALLSIVVVVLGFVLTTVASAGDWPQYRFDAGRTAASAESLSAGLHLAWVRELKTPKPAFPTEIRLRYDATYEPVVLGKTMFVPSMVADSLTALDTETGAERWRFVTDGPVRLAPVAWEGKVYFVSDDGHLYCVGADDGKLLWKFRGLPADREDRKLMGDGRLISLFPARGGPVLADGVVYFGAGIWWGEGVFVHALDATSGKPIWSNTDSNLIEKANMDHGVGYYAGLSPQGHLAIVDGKLVVPCGGQLPAILDPKTGKAETYTMGWGGRVGLAKGCAFVSGTGKYLLHGGDLYDIRRPNQERFREARARDFKPMLYLGGLTRLQIDRANQKGLGEFRQPVLAEGAMYCQQDGIAAWDLTQPKIEERAKSEIPSYRKEDKYPDKLKATFPQLWKLASKSKVHVKAGDRLYCSRVGMVEAVEIPKGDAEPKVAWQAKVQGTPHRMLAADGKLFVVTREGRIYAFGAEERAEPVVHAKPAAPAPEADQWTRRVARLLQATATADGYVLVLGVGTGRLAEEIVRQSRCDVIAVEPDKEKVARLRQQFHEAGLYGSRIAIHAGDPVSCSFPPYMASLIVSEDPALVADAVDQDLVKRLFRSLRPYGGTAGLPMSAAKQKAFAEAAAACELPGAVVRQTEHVVVLTRQGALLDTANWSHSGANAANTGASQDRVVKPPMTRLWFDGSFRWIRTPGTTVVRVAGGRVLVKAARLDAIDAYTGRHLWQAALPPSHNPGGEIVAVEDAIYLTAGKACVALDPATGEKSGQIDLPEPIEGRWSNVRVQGDLLVGASGKQLICMNRRNGQLLWKHERNERVGSIAIGGGKLFCADFVNRRRGQPAPDMSGVTAQAFELETGKPLWEITGGTDVRYGQAHDLVVTSGGVYRAGDGSQVRKAGGTWAITDEQQLTGNATKFAAFDLVTGSPSGKELSWFTRGCTPLRAGAMMMTTRYQGNAAFVDLASGEISSIWNVRAACSNNLFPANGVLNVPNLSGGCTCNYLPISQAFAPSAAFE